MNSEPRVNSGNFNGIHDTYKFISGSIYIGTVVLPKVKNILAN